MKDQVIDGCNQSKTYVSLNVLGLKSSKHRDELDIMDKNKRSLERQIDWETAMENEKKEDRMLSVE